MQECKQTERRRFHVKKIYLLPPQACCLPLKMRSAQLAWQVVRQKLAEASLLPDRPFGAKAKSQRTVSTLPLSSAAVTLCLKMASHTQATASCESAVLPAGGGCAPHASWAASHGELHCLEDRRQTP